MTHLLALAGISIISFSAIFVRLAGVSPSTAALFRMLYALPVLWLLSRLARGTVSRTARQRLMAAAAGLILSVDLTLWHHAIGLIGAGLATVLANVQVVFVALLAWLLHGERPTRAAAAVVPAALAGVALISGLGRPDAYGTDPALGSLLGAAAGAFYASFLVLYRASNPGRAAPAGPLLDATAGAAAGSLLLGLIDPGFSVVPAMPAHGWLVLLALLPQVAGWLLITRTLPRLPALETSVLLLIQPVATMSWGMLLLGERMAPVQWAGVLLVLAAVGYLSVRGSVEPPVSAPSEP